jgi:hypothetical protein
MAAHCGGDRQPILALMKTDDDAYKVCNSGTIGPLDELNKKAAAEAMWWNSNAHYYYYYYYYYCRAFDRTLF